MIALGVSHSNKKTAVFFALSKTLKNSNHSFKERKFAMSVTTQAFTYAINNIESLMKQAATETKKTIDNSAFDENDYFVITLKLTPSGFISDVSIESDTNAPASLTSLNL